MKEEDMYVLLQGPAHISPTSDGKQVQVIFLDDNGEPSKTPLKFTFDPANEKTSLKVMTLQVIIEVKRKEFDELKASGEINNIFPKIFNEIIKTDTNEPNMNPPDPPPFNNG